MTKIHAAARLVVAKADEAQARRYVEHMTGIKPGAIWENRNDVISFRVTWQERDAANKKLAKTLQPVPRHTADSSSSDSYYADASKTRIINLYSQSDYTHGIYGLISLVDRNHYETFMQRLKREREEKEKAQK